MKNKESVVFFIREYKLNYLICVELKKLNLAEFKIIFKEEELINFLNTNKVCLLVMELDIVSVELLGKVRNSYKRDILASFTEFNEKHRDLLNQFNFADYIHLTKDTIGYCINRVKGYVYKSLSRHYLQFLNVIQQSPLAVAITDIEGKIEYINKSFEKITGYSFEEIKGKNPRILKSGVQDKYFYKKMWETILSGKVWIGEFHNKRKDGSLYWDRSIIFSVKGVDENIISFIAIKEDITKQKNIYEQLKIYENFASENPNPVFRVSEEGIILFSNKSGEDILEYYDTNVNGIIPKEWLDIFEKAKKIGSVLEKEIKCNLDYYSLYFTPIKNENYINIYAINITKKKLVEQDLLDAREKANLANKAKSEFLSSMSHEIRTPLNSIVGMIEILKESGLDENQLQYLKILEESSNSLLHLINEILDLSKIESGQLNLESVKFYLKGFIQTMEAIFAHSAKQKNLSFNIYIDERLPKTLVGDPTRLKQVLINLIGNAIKFTERGKVELRIELENKLTETSYDIKFSVIDTGVGIDKEKIYAIFEPFMQADTSITRKYGGTGLGLAISKKIIEGMGGKLFVEGEPGIGSNFYFILNFDLTEKYSYEHKEESSIGIEIDKESILNKKLKILLVDDSDDNRFLIKKYFEKVDYKIDEAENGLEAIEKFKENKYDVILMDLQMPILDGYSATKTIRNIENYKELEPTPIIALSAYALKEDIRKSKSFGCNYHAVKPIKKNDLIMVLEKILNVKKKENIEEGILASAKNKEQKKPETFVVEIDEDLKELVPKYLEKRRQDIDLLKEWIKKEDFESIKSTGHKMKGSGGGYGFDEISRIGKEIEIAAKNNHKEKIIELISGLEYYLNNVKPVYKGDGA